MQEKKHPDHYPGKEYQKLFNYLHDEHGLTLAESEMYEIIQIVHRLYPQQGVSVEGVLKWAAEYRDEIGGEISLLYGKWFIVSEDEDGNENEDKPITYDQLVKLYHVHHPDEQATPSNEREVNVALYETRVVLYLLLKAFKDAPRNGKQIEYYREAEEILKKRFNIKDVLR